MSQQKEIDSQVKPNLSLKEKLANLKNKLASSKDYVESTHGREAIKEIQKVDLSDRVSKLLQLYNNSIVNNSIKINISGYVFETYFSNIERFPESLLYSIVKSNEFKEGQELFFDRNPITFSYLLYYIRYQALYKPKLSKIELINLKEEAEYFELEELSNYLAQKIRGVNIVKMEISGVFMDSKGRKAGTNKLEDIKNNKQLKVGAVCTNSPGWIIFHLNCDWQLSSVQLGPYIGDIDKGFKSVYGMDALIMGSSNGIVWTEIGRVPDTFGNKIISIPLIYMEGIKFVKIQSNKNPLGFSYVQFQSSE